MPNNDELLEKMHQKILELTAENQRLRKWEALSDLVDEGDARDKAMNDFEVELSKTIVDLGYKYELGSFDIAMCVNECLGMMLAVIGERIDVENETKNSAPSPDSV